MSVQPRTYSLESVTDISNTPIPHIPTVDRNLFGEYTGKSPQVAASKAYSSVLRHMHKFPRFYPDYEADKQLIVSIVETTSGKNKGRRHSYLGTRERAPQSALGARTVVSNGRVREYNWVNKMYRL